MLIAVKANHALFHANPYLGKSLIILLHRLRKSCPDKGAGNFEKRPIRPKALKRLLPFSTCVESISIANLKGLVERPGFIVQLFFQLQSFFFPAQPVQDVGLVGQGLAVLIGLQ